MKTEMLSARLDAQTKAAFTQICDEVGLSPSQAIKLFAKAVINHGGIPFELKARQPNAETIAAMQELIEGQGTSVGSADELIAELSKGQLPHV
ncbi:type II toxin-antitoxin system RelB/DinJ family antitoxin [Celerinatantimonas sp. YJH-8]|uniref:type II toxin-antitoxin system RelB/DinJ family antitoxin n=1 Tax=Celerinatantimonas sp. YJH-8 TaxID=3228714 RepID=UPI0038C50017